MWNAEKVKQLAEWYVSPQGSFALEQEYKLFQNLISIWPRRDYTLLNIGCGVGAFLEMFWDYGFDVTGLDNNLEVLELSSNRLKNRAEFQLGALDDLPFEDESFNYASLVTILEYVEDPKKILAEAFRVASDGIIVGFTNKWSINHIINSTLQLLHKKPKKDSQWVSPWQLIRLTKQLYPECRIYCRSTLLGPKRTWDVTSSWSKLNRIILSFPIGTYVGMRIEKRPKPTLTPLLLKAKEQAVNVYNALSPEATSTIQHNRTNK
ncbi:class I SAM-dependent methyltransferase [Lawsonia intracellularis]|uniref:SAM-dependent methyltransferases n=1 Tax=Lawsonia intracellularis (strain PHE/MN1-00) TaxID=363253 RepID=Q1MRH5_LAWIP|nr:class I SAM-dependent methyltransferase [Lawsonia intracellularis]AGC49758.1 methyltransferase domain-containing protein [Lawsonia intracellularis N343]KAA0205263.1 class I SAM-dependent methyltransferase [Lawsonia intracellularis]MBZ3892206.1 class I SAM-dependent methyltransferase [Lawsonia intracellularis]OMQ04526.1 SAM-dependent methyltransferase [Lawsonia intracellularis]RBN32190.1 class I SAM-dependent methyltransferase [Lawsonia intracellularis]